MNEETLETLDRTKYQKIPPSPQTTTTFYPHSAIKEEPPEIPDSESGSTSTKSNSQVY